MEKNPIKNIVIACMISGVPVSSMIAKTKILEYMSKDEKFADFITLSASTLAAGDKKENLTEEESAMYMAHAIEGITAEPINAIQAYEFYLKNGMEACIKSAARAVEGIWEEFGR